jgi:hypothetical protein
MLSLRDLLWMYLYNGEAPQSLMLRELVGAAVACLLLLALYVPLKKIIFYSLNPDAERSRFGAALLTASLIVSWLIASLDLFGLFSLLFALVITTVFFLIDGAYLLLTRGKV